MTKTILLADDSVTIQKVIELTFMDEDYEVVAASNGEQALERLDEVTPDVVIADVHMPGASGFDVARRSKQLHAHVPVLLLVGTFEPFEDSDFAASGADAYLKKPFDSQELLQRVNALLEEAPEPGAAAPAAEPPPAPGAPASAGELEVEEGFTIEEEPSWGADEPLLTPEPEPTAVHATAPTESLLPPIEEEPEEGTPVRAEPEPEPALDPEIARPGADGGTGPAAESAAPAGAGEATSAPEVGAAGEPAWSREPSPGEEAPAPDLGTRAIPTFGDRETAQPAPPPAAAGGPAAEGGEEPFPELSARAPGATAEREDLFGLDEGDGSTEVQPPPDMLEPDAPPTGGRPEESPLSVSTPPPEEEPRVEGRPPQATPAGETAAEAAAQTAAERPVQVPPAPPAEPLPSETPSAETRSSGVAEPAAPSAGAAAAGLSDEDVDRIARRVVELMGREVLRDVAWEVVPDLAEVVIKDRLRELESQVEES